LMLGTSVTAKNAPCNLNPQIREENPAECSVGNCPFYTALSEAQDSPIVMHSYASLMAQANISSHFGPRELLCMDEGHTAVDWIRTYLTSTIDPEDLLTLTTDEPPANPDFFLPWLRWQLRYLDMDEQQRGLSEEMAITLMKMKTHKKGFGIYEEAELQEMYDNSDEKEERSYESFAKRFLLDSGSVPWGTTWEEPNQWHPQGRWTIKPLKVATMAEALTGLGNKILIVTATVLHIKLFAAELGLKNFEMIDILSAFDPENRIVKKDYVGSMSYKNRTRTFPALIDKIERLANLHYDEPGIIHTHSHYLAGDVADALRRRMGGRMIEQLPRGGARTEVIQRFLSGGYGPNAILVGPSMMEGVDGADDSCRWQVMAKAPWPHMKDPTVEYLMKNLDRRWSSAWYTWKAAQITVQGIGRVVRSASDHGITYLLDSGFERIMKSGYIPEYIIDAVE